MWGFLGLEPPGAAAWAAPAPPASIPNVENLKKAQAYAHRNWLQIMQLYAQGYAPRNCINEKLFVFCMALYQRKLFFGLNPHPEPITKERLSSRL